MEAATLGKEPGTRGIALGEVVDGRYRVDEVIGEGGMGRVYRATQLTVGRPVALKVGSADRLFDERSMARFESEARTMAALQHPHIVSFIDFGRRPDGSLYMVMELLRGEPLSDLVAREAPLPEPRVRAIALQLLDALAAAHRHNIVHRDIKPSNVFLTRYGDRTDYVKLLDFGIAKANQVSPVAAAITDSVEVIGSPRYVSPEQARSQPVSARSDLYSLGAVLYEMLSGRPLFDEKSPVGWLVAHVTRDPRPPAVDDAELEGPLVDLVMQCLQKDPVARPESAAAAIAMLEGGPRPEPATHGTLPEPRTRFVGRDAAQGELEALVREQQLVTMVGIGGVGKTRLALEVARRAASGFADGAWFVDLAPVGGDAGVARAVAGAIGAVEGPGVEVIDAVTAALRDQRSLLVLDNCEHVLDAAVGVVQRLGRACPGVHVLATSRQPLHVAGEQVWQVATLPLPGRQAAHEGGEAFAARAATSEAARLFLDRARRVDPGFAIDASNAEAVVELCRRLDGIPLAIELAAARLRVLSVKELVSRLGQRLQLLSQPTRDGAARPRTLRAALDWSHDLLDASEQRVFRRLAVFAGGWTVDAAEQVCAEGDAEAWEVLDVLERLAERSLVHVERDADGRARHRLLETVREYALERLDASEEADAQRAVHTAHFVALAEASVGRLSGPEAPVWLDRLSADHENLRVATSRAVEAGDAETAWRLVGALREFWFTRGHFEEGRRVSESALALTGEGPPTVARARALDAAGVMAWLQGRPEAARGHLSEALAVYREHGDGPSEGMALKRLGTLAVEAHRWEEAEEHQQQALAIFRRLSDARGIRETLVNIAIARSDSGDSMAAIGPAEEALGLSRAEGDQGVAGRALYLLGQARKATGDRAGAWEALVEAFDIFRERGERLGVAYLLEAFGTWQSEEGEVADAVTLWAAGGAAREAIQAPLPPYERAAHEAMLVAARATLGDVAFDVCAARGRAMAVDEAAELALGRH